MLHLLGAGVYDQLGVWAARVQTVTATDDGAAGDTPSELTTPRVPRPAPPRPRNGGGWVNRWRR
jgi:hypothetical protein